MAPENARLTLSAPIALSAIDALILRTTVGAATQQDCLPTGALLSFPARVALSRPRTVFSELEPRIIDGSSVLQQTLSAQGRHLQLPLGWQSPLSTLHSGAARGWSIRKCSAAFRDRDVQWSAAPCCMRGRIAQASAPAIAARSSRAPPRAAVRPAPSQLPAGVCLAAISVLLECLNLVYINTSVGPP